MKNNIYRINIYGSSNLYVECANTNILAKYVAELEIKGCIVTSVVRIRDTETSRVAVKTNSHYKKKISELLGENRAKK